MDRTIAALVACGLFAACASPDDDSWSGAADEELVEDGEGAGGNQKPSSTTVGASTTVAATVTSVTASTVAASTTVTTGNPSCDGGSCDSCQSCAMNGMCAPQIDACLNDADCYALIECLQSCVDDVCMNNCASSHPSGMTLYSAAGECVFCDACPVSCGAC